MFIWRCDHCGKEGSPKEDQDWVENWETVVVSSMPAHHICDDCAHILFDFLSAAKEKPGTSNEKPPGPPANAGDK